MRVHLVDGTYELYRAHFAPRPGHHAPGGWDAKATVGVAASLLYLLADPQEAVTHIAVAFDNPIRSFRNDLWPGYKSDEGVPPELHAQFGPVEDAVRALGITVWSMKEYEADDALATGARLFRDQVAQIRILTPDKDLGQCIVGDRVVQVDRRQRRVTDEAEFRDRRGFAPLGMPDFLALTGDAADGFPGLRGFGEKSAGLLVGAYERLENIPHRASEWRVKLRGSLTLADTLARNFEAALLFRHLATLVDTVPLSPELEDVCWQGVPQAEFQAWCKALGADALKDLPRKWRP